MANQPNLISAYTLAQPTSSLNPRPIVAKRAPLASDTGYILGQVWIYAATNTPYILTSVTSASANWQILETQGSVGIFSSLTVNPGPTVLDGAVTMQGPISITTSDVSVAATFATAASPIAVVTINHRAGIASFTGFTTAQSAGQSFEIINSTVDVASALLCTVANLNASGNGALMRIDGITLQMGRFSVECFNDGGGDLGIGDDVNITFWVMKT